MAPKAKSPNHVDFGKNIITSLVFFRMNTGIVISP